MNDRSLGGGLQLALFLLITLLALLTACHDTDPGVADVKREVGEAVETASAFVTEQVAAYRAQMRDKVEEMGPQIEALKARASELSDQGKAELQDQLAKLEQRRAELRTRIDTLKAQGGDAWEFLGLLSLYDPPREDTAATISSAQALGIEVKMVTGDHIAIAKETSRLLGLHTNILQARTPARGSSGKPGGR